jgi:hypothetical protein
MNTDYLWKWEIVWAFKNKNREFDQSPAFNPNH